MWRAAKADFSTIGALPLAIEPAHQRIKALAAVAEVAELIGAGAGGRKQDRIAGARALPAPSQGVFERLGRNARERRRSGRRADSQFLAGAAEEGRALSAGYDCNEHRLKVKAF